MCQMEECRQLTKAVKTYSIRMLDRIFNTKKYVDSMSTNLVNLSKSSKQVNASNDGLDMAPLLFKDQEKMKTEIEKHITETQRLITAVSSQNVNFTSIMGNSNGDEEPITFDLEAQEDTIPKDILKRAYSSEKVSQTVPSSQTKSIKNNIKNNQQLQRSLTNPIGNYSKSTIDKLSQPIPKQFRMSTNTSLQNESIKRLSNISTTTSSYMKIREKIKERSSVSPKKTPSSAKKINGKSDSLGKKNDMNEKTNVINSPDITEFDKAKQDTDDKNLNLSSDFVFDQNDIDSPKSKGFKDGKRMQ